MHSRVKSWARALRRRLGRSDGDTGLSYEQTIDFELRVLEAARAVAARGDHRIIAPTDSARVPPKPIEELRIGFFGNLANNAYMFVKCLNRLGFRAELVLEDGSIDAFLLNRPFWDDVPVECANYDDGLRFESGWQTPPSVRRVSFDREMEKRYAWRLSAIPEVTKLYRDAFGVTLAADVALLLAQNMGHWPYIVAMRDYDIVQFSMFPICLGPFCPRPYVVFPVGGDLYQTPFEQTVLGLLTRAAYRGACQILVCETDYPAYLDRLDIPAQRTFLPLLFDTDTYCPGSQAETRRQWSAVRGGERFLFSVCRQSWEWKGNDRLFRGFQRFLAEGNNEWRLVLQDWGTDTERSKALISQLHLQDRVIWQRLCSKPVLRQRQQACDAVADQFVMEGYGTSVLESLAAAKPVLMAPTKASAQKLLGEPPPFVGAKTDDEIAAGLRSLRDHGFRSQRGAAGRDWVEQHHGFRRLGPKYMEAYHRALQTA